MVVDLEATEEELIGARRSIKIYLLGNREGSRYKKRNDEGKLQKTRRPFLSVNGDTELTGEQFILSPREEGRGQGKNLNELVPTLYLFLV